MKLAVIDIINLRQVALNFCYQEASKWNEIHTDCSKEKITTLFTDLIFEKNDYDMTVYWLLINQIIEKN